MYDHWALRTVTAIFLLFVGGLINQFLNIPAQQARTDAKLAFVEKQVIMEEQGRQAKTLKDISDRLDTHDRRSRRK